MSYDAEWHADEPGYSAILGIRVLFAVYIFPGQNVVYSETLSLNLLLPFPSLWKQPLCTISFETTDFIRAFLPNFALAFPPFSSYPFPDLVDLL